ncbi:MAG TPA: PAS domain S-box protein [Alphaproteobacteria bacterium]|nr:PAS domain S-box protein [Alphaproteobacteria bacterium]
MLRTEDIVHQASDAAFVVDREQRILAWNRRAEELLGYSRNEVLGHFCYDVIGAVLPDGQRLCTPDCQAKASFGCGKPYANGHCLSRGKNGEWVNMQLSSIVFSDAGTAGGKPRRDGAGNLVMLRPLKQAALNVSPAPVLRVFALGRFGLVVGDQSVGIARWARKQALTLLRHLVTARGNPVHRERLIECLWPDATERQGRERFKVTVYFLRRQLRRANMAEEVIGTSGETYWLRRERIWVDADVFEARVNEGRTLDSEKRLDAATRCYGEARKLYNGDYFAEYPYEDWCAEERERLREIYLDMLGWMAEANAARGEYAKAVQVCREALVREPCRESQHRALMGYLTRLGRSDEALAQFDHCRRVLARDLGVEPMPETHLMYRQILKGRTPRKVETL